MPAFARCCFCIAANLLVFTNPMASPITITSFLQAKQHREVYNCIEITKPTSQTSTTIAHLFCIFDFRWA